MNSKDHICVLPWDGVELSVFRSLMEEKLEYDVAALKGNGRCANYLHPRDTKEFCGP